MRQRTKQSGAGRTRQAVGQTFELAEEIENALRHRPVERQMAADFGDGVIGHEQTIGPRAVGRRFAELIAPQAHLASRF